MDVNSELFVGQLVSILQKEIELYTKYTALLEEERHFLVKFKEEKVNAITAKRIEVYNSLESLQKERMQLMESFPDWRGKKLYDLVIKHMHHKNAKRVLPLVTQLREVVKKTEASGKQHSQILSFSLRSIQGVLSILWSATQTVVKSYNSKGKMQNSYHPSDSRSAGVLKQA